MNRLSERIKSFLGSKLFFYLVLGFFLLQAGWIAASALYPMAFDEAYHFETIQLYAEQWSPRLAEHPEEAEGLAAVHRYPSYLFHYLFSFPYRVTAEVTADETTQILALRLLNIALVAGGLVLLRRLFITSRVSPALTHVAILFFTLIPIVPLLAAHINYDNLLLLLVPAIFLLTQRLMCDVQSKTIRFQPLLLWLSLLLLSGIVKYAMLPIITAVVVFVVGYAWWQWRPLDGARLRSQLQTAWRQVHLASKIGLIGLVLVSGILAFERYGLNLLQYNALVPSCDDVISYEECLEFGPFARNQAYLEDRDPDFEPSRLEHTGQWFSGMWYRLFFMINGDVPVDRYHNFAPLPIMAIGFSVLLVAGVGAMVRYRKQVFYRQPWNTLLLAVTLFYSLVLLQSNFSGYAELGRTAALNGRYLLLVLPLFLIPMSWAVAYALQHRDQVKTGVAIVALAVLLQGGGLTSFIVRSSDTWYWPHPIVQDANQRAQYFLDPLIYGSDEEHLNFIPR